MNKRNLIILGIIILTTTVLAGGLFWYNKYQNKETIVDLGDGWESYHHNKIGLTVKIPRDAIITVDQADTLWAHKVKFSDGIIDTIGSVKMVALHNTQDYNLTNQIDIAKLRKKVKDGAIKTRGTNFNNMIVDTKTRYYEVKFKNKIAFVKEVKRKKENQKQSSQINSITILIPGHKRQHNIVINTKILYNQYPYLNNMISSKQKINEYLKIVAPYILEIDNF